QRFDVILSDVVMPGKDGLALLEDLKMAGVTAPVVMISGQATVEMAVRATRLGAIDFLEKPLSTEKLLVTVENALRLTRLEEENRELRQRLGKHEMVWVSPVMERLMVQVERVAASETRVCILGETGTGKELVARTIHNRSPRRGGRRVAVDVRGIAATHRNLDELVRQNAFRQDLYHRIYVFPLLLPPLRERVEDIPALVENFGRQVAVQNGWKEKAFAAEAIEE